MFLLRNQIIRTTSQRTYRTLARRRNSAFGSIWQRVISSSSPLIAHVHFLFPYWVEIHNPWCVWSSERVCGYTSSGCNPCCLKNVNRNLFFPWFLQILENFFSLWLVAWWLIRSLNTSKTDRHTVLGTLCQLVPCPSSPRACVCTAELGAIHQAYFSSSAYWLRSSTRRGTDQPSWLWRTGAGLHTRECTTLMCSLFFFLFFFCLAKCQNIVN